jgi:hypothetical protein
MQGFTKCMLLASYYCFFMGHRTICRSDLDLGSLRNPLVWMPFPWKTLTYCLSEFERPIMEEAPKWLEEEQ